MRIKIKRKQVLEIVSIRRRNWLAWFLSLDQYRVTVILDGQIKEVNCWAGKFGSDAGRWAHLKYSILDKLCLEEDCV